MSNVEKIEQALAEELAKTHPNLTPRQRRAIFDAALELQSPATLNDPAWVSLAVNRDCLAGDLESIKRKAPHLFEPPPSALELFAAESALRVASHLPGLDPGDRLKRIRHLESLTDDERITTGASLVEAAKRANVTLTKAEKKEAAAVVEKTLDAEINAAATELAGPGAGALKRRAFGDSLRAELRPDQQRERRLQALNAEATIKTLSPRDRLLQARLASGKKG